MQAGNQNASPSYVLSQIEKASASATEFSTAFNNFIADGPNSEHAEIIRTVSVFSGSIADVLSNTKGLTRFATDDKKADQLVGAARSPAESTMTFFVGVSRASERLFFTQCDQRGNPAPLGEIYQDLKDAGVSVTRFD